MHTSSPIILISTVALLLSFSLDWSAHFNFIPDIVFFVLSLFFRNMYFEYFYRCVEDTGRITVDLTTDWESFSSVKGQNIFSQMYSFRFGQFLRSWRLRNIQNKSVIVQFYMQLLLDNYQSGKGQEHCEYQWISLGEWYALTAVNRLQQAICVSEEDHQRARGISDSGKELHTIAVTTVILQLKSYMAVKEKEKNTGSYSTVAVP